METKIAETEEEFDQIHILNYQTFVLEIPQHPVELEHKRVDKFHNKNTYIIAKEGEKVIGMLAYNTMRPFSLDYKMARIEAHLPLFFSPAEIRLLSIVKEKRKSRVIYHLLKRLVQELQNGHIDIVLISGTTRELNFYRKIGFVNFAYLMGLNGAQFQPMYLKKENIQPEFLKEWLTI